MASQLGTVVQSPHSSRTSMELFWFGCRTPGTQRLPVAGVTELQDTESHPAPATHSEARAAAAQTRRRMAAFSTPRRGAREGDIQTPPVCAAVQRFSECDCCGEQTKRGPSTAAARDRRRIAESETGLPTRSAGPAAIPATGCCCRWGRRAPALLAVFREKARTAAPGCRTIPTNPT